MMNLERELVFCYIEEDNIQRAYFRVRPLLTINGDVQEEARRIWPDDGCLRIVPDRNEQHTFKDRMRNLGGYCVVNLQGIPADANKIRTNKNYKPDKGESNQFILYSDTVHPLPDHTFFEVLEGDPADFAALAEKSLTPLFYIRDNDTIYGPVRRSEPASPAPAEEAAGMLYPLICPDGNEHAMLCIDQPTPVKAVKMEFSPAPVDIPAHQEEALPIGKPLEILDKNKNFQETLQGLDQPLSKGANLLHQETKLEDAVAPSTESKPLSGTPLFRAPMRTSVPQPKNKLQEFITAQWRVARNEPPTSPLPAGATMHQVENPVEIASTSMRNAWQVPEAQTQLIDLILSLDGMRAKLEPRMSEAPDSTPLQKTLKSRLDSMEAERLAALLELDKAKADVESYRHNIINNLSEKARAEVTRLEGLKAEHEASVAALRQQQSALIAQRDELIRRVDELQRIELPAALAQAMADAQVAAPVAGTPLHLKPIVGENVQSTELIRRVVDTLAASGLNLHRNYAIAILAVLAVSSRIGVTSLTPSAAATLIGNIAFRLGWNAGFAHQVTPEQKPVLSSMPAAGTPAVLLTSLAAYSPLPDVTKIFMARNAINQTRNTAYEACSWPIFPLGSLPFIPQLRSIALAPVSAASLKALADSHAVSFDEVRQVFSDIMMHVAPLSGAAFGELHRFVSACTPLMDGGLASAVDWAILLWIIPAVERIPKTIAAIKPLLEEYPLSLAALQS